MDEDPKPPAHPDLVERLDRLIASARLIARERDEVRAHLAAALAELAEAREAAAATPASVLSILDRAIADLSS